MAKKRVDKFPRAFRPRAVDRLTQCTTSKNSRRNSASVGGCCICGARRLSRLPIAALAHALAEQHRPPGLVHHSDRGVQYASEASVTLLRAHLMIPSMSRSANPYDNASCESFMKTLKQEEVYANTYRVLDHLRTNMAVFIEPYDNRGRLHSALDYHSPEEFEDAARSVIPATGATMRFFRPRARD